MHDSISFQPIPGLGGHTSTDHYLKQDMVSFYTFCAGRSYDDDILIRIKLSSLSDLLYQHLSKVLGHRDGTLDTRRADAQASRQ